MSRRRNNSAAEDLMAMVALLPWWAGVGLALVSYFVLRQFAGQMALAGGRPGAAVAQSMWRGLATAGQYFMPLIFLAGAGMSAWRQRERRHLVQSVAASSSADVLNNMTWQEFERLVGEGFRLQGFRVVETGGGGADGGVDLVLHKNGEKYLVQCKQWRAFKVGVKVVREFYGVMTAEGAAGGYVVTSGRFTVDALSFAEGLNVTLIDKPALHELILRARAAVGLQQGAVRCEPAAHAPAPSATPVCPVCAGSMVRRTARRGSHAGTAFWGCSGYPRCKGTRSTDG